MKPLSQLAPNYPSWELVIGTEHTSKGVLQFRSFWCPSPTQRKGSLEDCGAQFSGPETSDLATVMSVQTLQALRDICLVSLCPQW